MVRLEDVSNLYKDSNDTPFDLVSARRDSMQYHREYGMPAIIKRAYNSDHVGFQEGPQGEPVRRDSTYDDAYGQGFFSPTAAIGDNEFSEYGIGWFTFLTLQDTTVDDSDPTNRGAQKLIATMGEVSWYPTLWDGDLIILVEIERKASDEIEIINAGDRFVVQATTPITMRGTATPYYIPNQESNSFFLRDRNRAIAQNFQAVRMPRYHRVYRVPIL